MQGDWRVLAKREDGEKLVNAKELIDVWAACRRHVLEGGTGFPALEDVSRPLSPPDPCGRRSEDSNALYEASRRKYDVSASSQRVPDGTFPKYILVEEVLRDMFLTQDPERGETLGCLPLFTEYLLLVYPDNAGVYSLSVTEADAAVEAWLLRQFPGSTYTERKNYADALGKTSRRLVREVGKRLVGV